MIHTEEDRRDHDIDVDRSNPNTYYDRDRRETDPAYVSNELEQVVYLFRSQRRRIIIRRLAELDQKVDGRRTIGHNDLAREIGAIEDDVDLEIVSTRSLRSIRSGLHNNKLPILDEFSVVDWNRDEREITTTKNTQAFATLLDEFEEAVEQSEIPTLVDRRTAVW